MTQLGRILVNKDERKEGCAKDGKQVDAEVVAVNETVALQFFFTSTCFMSDSFCAPQMFARLLWLRV